MKVYVDENPNTNNIVMSMSIVLLSKKSKKNKKNQPVDMIIIRKHYNITEAFP